MKVVYVYAEWLLLTNANKDITGPIGNVQVIRENKFFGMYWIVAKVLMLKSTKKIIRFYKLIENKLKQLQLDGVSIFFVVNISALSQWLLQMVNGLTSIAFISFWAFRLFQKLVKQMEGIYLLMTITNTDQCGFALTHPFGWLGALYLLFTWAISILLLWLLLSRFLWEKSCSICYGNLMKIGISQGSGC